MLIARSRTRLVRAEQPVATHPRIDASMNPSGPRSKYREERWEFCAGVEPAVSRHFWEFLGGVIPTTESAVRPIIRARTIRSARLSSSLFKELPQQGARPGVSNSGKFSLGMVSSTTTARNVLVDAKPVPVPPYTSDHHPCQVLTHQARTAVPDCGSDPDGLPPAQLLAAQSISGFSKSRARGGPQG